MSILRIIPALLATAAIVQAHGLVVTWRPAADAVVIQAVYDDESDPAAAADVVIYPSDEDDPYVSGVTDRNGLFAFVPEHPGRWVAVVDDGFGHLETLDIDNSEAGAAATHVGPSSAAGGSSWRDLVTGLSVLFGLTGLWLWRKSGANG